MAQTHSCHRRYTSQLIRLLYKNIYVGSLYRWIYTDWSPKEQWRRTSLRGQRRRWFWTILSFREWTLLVELYWTATQETPSKMSEITYGFFHVDLVTVEMLKLSVFSFANFFTVQTLSIKKNWLLFSSLEQRIFSKRQKEKSLNHRYDNEWIILD